MKTYRIFAAILVLALALLACQAFGGGGGDSGSAPSTNDGQGAPSSNSNAGDNGGGAKSEYAFPTTNDAFNVTELGEDSLLYYTKMAQEDVMNFYRDEYIPNGYKEREILTVVSDTTFSMVFDGDPSGKAVVIQSVDLGDGSSTVAIRLEEVQ